MGDAIFSLSPRGEGWGEGAGAPSSADFHFQIVFPKFRQLMVERPSVLWYPDLFLYVSVKHQGESLMKKAAEKRLMVRLVARELSNAETKTVAGGERGIPCGTTTMNIDGPPGSWTIDCDD